MAEQEHLAIASVPFQNWGELYEQAKALSIGTIFRDLDMPFFASEQDFGNIPGSCPSQRPGDLDEYREDVKDQSSGQQGNECMMLQIMEVSFMMDDIRLYLDTHSEDKNGLQLLKQVIQKRKQLMKDFADKNFPLTMDCMADLYEKNPESDCYCWKKGQVPWEGACV